MSSLSRLKSTSFGFGLERLGLISLRFPKLVLSILVLLCIASITGATHLKFESDTHGLFRSERSDYTKFEEVEKLYPGQTNRLLLVISGPALKTAQGLEKLRSLHLELEFIDEVARVDSLFTARHPPQSAKDKGRPFVPDPLDETIDLKALLAAIKNDRVVKNKLLSPDGSTALMIATLNPDIQDIERTSELISKITSTANQILATTGLKIATTGLPVIRTQVIHSLQRDQIIFIAAGVIIGLFFSFLFFREIKYVIITEIPVVVSVAGLMGGMWLFGQKINVLSGMVTPLISSISLASSLHLAFAIRRARTRTPDLKRAIRTAILETGPGCVLSSLTTALALITLMVAPFPFIHNFGTVAVFGTLFSLFATLLSLPAAAYLILKTWPSKQIGRTSNGSLDSLVNVICRASVKAVACAPWILTGFGIIAVAVMGIAYMQNKPRYTSSENLPATSTAVQTINLIDNKLAGSSLIRLLLKWPDSERFPTTNTLEAVADANKILADQPWIKAVWSLSDVVDWARSGGLSRSDSLKVIKNIQDKLTGQVLTVHPDTALLTGYFPNTNARTLLPRLKIIEARINEFHTKWPQVKATLTGVSALEAVTSTKIIETINWSLLSAIAMIILLITIALRSIQAGLVSVIPNLFPIAAGGAYLFLTDQGLQFTSVLAFTIGFGIAVDSTIHYINHYSLAKNTGLSSLDAIRQTSLNVGPVLVITTIIIASGLGATMLSDLPLVKLYGEVSVLVLTAALFADLVILPAIIKIVDREKTVQPPPLGMKPTK